MKRVFNTIAVETGALCNRSCIFCPNHDFARPDEWMPMDLIEKIINDLVSIDYKGRFEPYIYNEPMRDQRLLDIIAKVREALPRVCIMINTNGDYIKGPDDIRALQDAGLNQLSINVYSAKDGTAQHDHGVVVAQAREKQLQAWLDEVPFFDQQETLYRYIPTSRGAGRVNPKYGVNLETGEGFGGGFGLTNRSGNLSTIDALEEPLEKMCVKPFRFFNIDWKGQPIVCCNDYNSQTAFGNVRDTHVLHLWRSATMQAYRMKLLRKDRNIFLCDKCSDPGGPYPHMVEHVEYDEEVVRREMKRTLLDVTIERRQR